MLTPLTTAHRLSGGLMHWLRRDAHDFQETQAPRPIPLIYRLRSWPTLTEDGRTAEIYRLLSVMSNRPVSRDWMLSRSRLQPDEVDSLLDELEAAGDLEVIDPSHFPASR